MSKTAKRARVSLDDTDTTSWFARVDEKHESASLDFPEELKNQLEARLEQVDAVREQLRVKDIEQLQRLASYLPVDLVARQVWRLYEEDGETDSSDDENMDDEENEARRRADKDALARPVLQVLATRAPDAWENEVLPPEVTQSVKHYLLISTEIERALVSSMPIAALREIVQGYSA